MNLGYLGEEKQNIDQGSLKHLHHINLYKELVDMVPVISSKARDISAIEIGCGRGGGCYLLKEHYKIGKIKGVDLSPSNIKLASRLVSGVKFVCADAVEFKTDEKFDVVVNLESSHRYSSRLIFFKNASEMMDRNAYFVFGDLIRSGDIKVVEKMFQECGLKIVKRKNINDGVIRSIYLNSPRQYPIATKLPFLFPMLIHNFFVTIHSKVYKRLNSNEVLYNLYLLEKI